MTAPISPPRLAWLLLVLAGLPWAVGLGNELQDVDPAQYADVARQIAEGGGWLDLRDSQGPFTNKPPLAIWAQAAAIKLLGATSAAARLPTVLFALLALLGTLGLGRALLDPTRAAIGGCLFAASVAVHQMVADPKVDLALTATATCALWAFVEARRRPGFVWLGWLFAGLAVASKGPLGLALPAAAIVPEALRHRWGAADPGRWWERIAAFKPVRGLALVGAIAAPYYWAIYQRDGSDGAGFVLWRQNIGRLLGQSGYRNDTTVLFFLHTALWAFLPFTPLLIAGFASRARAVWRSRALPPSERRVLLWGFWIPFAVFSLSEYKLPQYIFCLAPVAALLAADVLVGFEPVAARRMQRGFQLIGAAVTALTAWLLLDCFPAPSPGWPLALIAAIPIGAWAAARQASLPWQATAAAVGATAAFHLALAAWVHPEAVSFQAGRALAERAWEEDSGAKILPFVGTSATFGASYYSHKRAAAIGLDEVASLVHSGRLHTAIINPDAPPDFASVGVTAEPIARFASYPTSRPTLSFLRASTRPSQLQWRELVRLRPR